MFDAFRKFCERLLRIPPQPQAPPGDEGSTQIFRASPNYLRYRKLCWAVTALVAIGLLVLFAVVPLVGATMVAKKLRGYRPLLLIIPAVLFLAMVAGQLFRLAVLQLDYEKRWYVVTDRSLRIREGVVSVNEMTVTPTSRTSRWRRGHCIAISKSPTCAWTRRVVAERSRRSGRA